MPTVTADRAVKHTDRPLRITKRIGSTPYKVSAHFSRTSRETMDDKLIRLIECEAYLPRRDRGQDPCQNFRGTDRRQDIHPRRQNRPYSAGGRRRRKRGARITDLQRGVLARAGNFFKGQLKSWKLSSKYGIA